MKGRGSVTKACEVCSGSYRVQPCRKDSARFCSHACLHEAMRAGLASLGLRSSSKHHRKWTPAEDAIVRAHYLDKGPGGVEHMLRARSYAAIKERAKVLGVSRDPERRISDMQTGVADPLLLMGCVSGGRQLEEHMHAVFEKDRIKGEWFRSTPELREMIKGLLASYSVMQKAKEQKIG